MAQEGGVLKRVMVGPALCLGLFVRAREPAAAANFGTAVGLTGQPDAGLVEVRYIGSISATTGAGIITGITITGTTGVTTGTAGTSIITVAVASHPRLIARKRSVRSINGGSQRWAEPLDPSQSPCSHGRLLAVLY